MVVTEILDFIPGFIYLLYKRIKFLQIFFSLGTKNSRDGLGNNVQHGNFIWACILAKGWQK
jgi:hypothetical protein